MFKLDCAVQSYAWGKFGNNSSVAKFKAAQNIDFIINENKPYAELWMGTHINGPSIIMVNEKNHIKLNEYIGTELPFLFKILSVNQALSIQAHPNKQLASFLHEKDPKNYPDDNHKPEMLIALTKFNALCGFRQSNEIQYHFETIPSLVKLCDQANVDEFKATKTEISLKKCFNSMMNRDEKFIRDVFHEFLENYASYSLSETLKELFIRLNKEYPFDIGCFSIFLLNYYELQPNEAIFLQANIPHAYLYGEGVECMACSDNVVRAGLTPKFKDVQTLVDMLDYNMCDLNNNLVYPLKINENIFEYNPNVNEFSVERIDISSSSVSEISLPAIKKYSILIIINSNDDTVALVGDHTIELKKGLVFFIDKNIEIKLRGEKNLILLAYRAYANTCDT